MRWCGKEVTRAQVQAMIKLLRYYRDFLKSDCKKAIIPNDIFQDTMGREEARRRLDSMIHTAINWKAGIILPRKASCDYQIPWRRDQQRLADIHRRIRVYQFESQEVKARFSDRLARFLISPSVWNMATCGALQAAFRRSPTRPDSQ